MCDLVTRRRVQAARGTSGPASIVPHEVRPPPVEGWGSSGQGGEPGATPRNVPVSPTTPLGRGRGQARVAGVHASTDAPSGLSRYQLHKIASDVNPRHR